MSQQSRRVVDFCSAVTDVAPASGASEWVELPRRAFVIFMAELLTLVGGTTPGVTFTLQESNDKATITDLSVEAALTAAGIRAKRITGAGKRYARIAWATTGTPDSATAEFFITAR
jgi:cyclophilin family peptidyl-prolyl cis-trans isomerase